MKRDLGKRTYSEMYLITKENKNLLDKCIKGLNENLTTKDKIVVNKLDKQTQTSNQQTEDIPIRSASPPSLDESIQNTTISPLSTKVNESPASTISETHTNKSGDLMLYDEEIVKKKDKKGFKKSKKKNQTPDLQFGLYSPMSTRSKNKIKLSTKDNKDTSSSSYQKWT